MREAKTTSQSGESGRRRVNSGVFSVSILPIISLVFPSPPHRKETDSPPAPKPHAEQAKKTNPQPEIQRREQRDSITFPIFHGQNGQIKGERDPTINRSPPPSVPIEMLNQYCFGSTIRTERTETPAYLARPLIAIPSGRPYRESTTGPTPKSQ